jgi:hypothetical protein
MDSTSAPDVALSAMSADLSPAQLVFEGGRFALRERAARRCHGFANGCECGCTPRRPAAPARCAPAQPWDVARAA